MNTTTDIASMVTDGDAVCRRCDTLQQRYVRMRHPSAYWYSALECWIST